MLRKPLLCALTLILLGAAAAGAVTPYLVEDLNPEGANGSSAPHLFLTLDNGISIFKADDGEHGIELWRSDGTAAGTYRLTDTTCPTFCWDDNSNERFKVAGNRLFFVTWDESRRPTLWVTGGSAQDTVPLAETDAVLSEAVWVESRGLLFFRTMGHGQDNALWRTDGTPAGTWMVGPNPPVEMTAYKGRLFFSLGSALWSTDGTPAGTRLVRRFTNVESLVVAGEWLLFFSPHSTSGYTLWRSDGTRRGTTPLLRLDGRLERADELEALAHVVAGRLWFVMGSTSQPLQDLWVSDGTPRGTRRLARFTGSFKTVAVPRVALGGRVLFRADDTAHGMEPWISDGTPAGTRLLRDVCPGACSSNPGPISTFGNRFFFAANDGTRGVEPWLSDGTAAGTRLLRDLCRGGCSSAPQAPRVQGGRAIFTALDAQGRSQLWRTNGTANGTIRLTTLPHGVGELATHPVAGAFLFRAWDAEHGDELWRTDGTRPGTRLVADLNTMDVGGSFPRELIPLGQEVAFVADGPDSAGIVRPGLWKSGGTAANTVLLGILPPCEQELLLRGVLPDGSFVFLCPEESGLSLWRGDGTAAGTFNLLPAGRSLDSRQLAIVGSALFFSSFDSETGGELWVSHGNPGDARQVMDIEPGFLSSYPRGLTPFQGRLFFHASSLAEDLPLLYVTNGTAAGTVQLLPGINAGILGEHDGRLWLSVVDDSLNYALWSTDGTPQGTRHEVDLPGSSGPARLFSAGNRMFLAEMGAFWISDGTAAGTRRIETEFFLPSESRFALVGGRLFYTNYFLGAITLWQSDGTDAGSGQVLGPDGLPLTDPEDLTAFAGRLYFHRDGALWSTDGTPAGTVRVEGGFSSPGELTVAGPRLFFRATDPVHGMELWALE